MIDLVKVEPTAGERTAYEVYVGGVPYGVVGSRRRGTYRKYGRYRYPTGNETYWAIRGERLSHSVFRTRKSAVAALLRRTAA